MDQLRAALVRIAVIGLVTRRRGAANGGLVPRIVSSSEPGIACAANGGNAGLYGLVQSQILLTQHRLAYAAFQSRLRSEVAGADINSHGFSKNLS